MKRFARLFLLVAQLLVGVQVTAAPFRPTEPIMPLTQVRAGMKGYGKTTFQDGKITKFPIEVVDVISKKGRPSKLILIRASGPDIDRVGGLANGMSGSPIYVDGKLIGAFSFGWDFGDPKMGLVTPIEQMIALFDWPEKPLEFPKLRPTRLKSEPTPVDRRFNELYDRYIGRRDMGSVPPSGFGGEFILPQDVAAEEVDALARYARERQIIAVDGISRRAMDAVGEKLNARVISGGAGDNHALSDETPHLVPGDSISALIAWGDVTVDAGGTLTALDRTGRFIAFGHGFKNWGAVAYPVARSSVHGVINSIESPFKLTSAENIVGTITQDRSEGVAGYLGRYPAAVSVRLEVTDRDAGHTAVRRFQLINDEHAVTLLLPELLTGLIDRELGRQAGGTIRYDVTITGNGMPDDWTVGDVVVADEDVATSAVTPMTDLVGKVIKNPYQSLGIPGLKVKVAVTEATRRLIIEGVSVDHLEYHPGDEILVTVTLRPWRRHLQKHTFKLRVPEDAEGGYTVQVRAGSPDSSDSEGEPSSERKVASFAQYLQELQSGEHACEVIVELASSDAKSGSETATEARRRKIREGTLRVFRSEYVVDGSLQVPLIVTPSKKD